MIRGVKQGCPLLFKFIFVGKFRKGTEEGRGIGRGIGAKKDIFVVICRRYGAISRK